MRAAPAPIADWQPVYYLDCGADLHAALALAHLFAGGGRVACVAADGGVHDPLMTALTLVDLIAMFGKTDVPVVGASAAISSVPARRTQASQINSIGLPASDGRVLTTAAPVMLARLTRRYPGRLRVIALGSLANLAQAIRHDPALPSLVHSVTVLDAHPDHRVQSPVRTRVLDAGWPVSVVPRSLGASTVLDEDDRIRLGGQGGAGYLLGAMLFQRDDAVGTPTTTSSPLHGAVTAAVAERQIPTTTFIRNRLLRPAGGSTGDALTTRIRAA